LKCVDFSTLKVEIEIPYFLPPAICLNYNGLNHEISLVKLTIPPCNAIDLDDFKNQTFARTLNGDLNPVLYKKNLSRLPLGLCEEADEELFAIQIDISSDDDLS